jgi:hypothetical protein
MFVRSPIELKKEKKKLWSEREGAHKVATSHSINRAQTQMRKEKDDASPFLLQAVQVLSSL